MPFAGYKDFDACVVAQIRDGETEDAARRICGRLQADAEGKGRRKKSVEAEGPGAALAVLGENSVGVKVGRSVAEIEAELSAALEEAADAGLEEISEAYILDDGSVASAEDVFRSLMSHSMRGLSPDQIHREAGVVVSAVDVSKAVVAGSVQSDRESRLSEMSSMADSQVVEPPYPPELLSVFLEVDETHFRCVRTKTTDGVCRDFDLIPAVAVDVEGEGEDRGVTTEGPRVSQEEISTEVERIRAFLESANENIGFDGVLERAGLDFESIGWAAIEVIRSADGQIRKLAHVPADRVRVLRGWRGFVELRSAGQVTYFQNFGEKLVNPGRKNPLSGRPEPYNPRVDGPIDMGRLEWSMVDYRTGEPTDSLASSANELLWIPKHHAKTIYYGVPDMVPSLGQILANIHIRDYQLQYYEHNAVPRYAIIIEGGALSDPVKELIQEYFSTHIKGKAHKTLIIPVKALRGEVRVRFEKLDVGPQEASFLETRKTNAQAILTSHGVSPAIIGVAEHSELGSGKGLSQAEIYKDRIVTPLQKRWASAINKLLRLGLGVQYVALRFRPLDVRDQKAEQETYCAYLDKGVVTINEVRLRAGLGDPVPGGDRPFINVPGQGLVYIDEIQDAVADDRARLEAELATTKKMMGAAAAVNTEG